jgi:hypothetical protein
MRYDKWCKTKQVNVSNDNLNIWIGNFFLKNIRFSNDETQVIEIEIEIEIEIVASMVIGLLSSVILSIHRIYQLARKEFCVRQKEWM